MQSTHKSLLLLTLLTTPLPLREGSGVGLLAQNPIVQTQQTTDPAPFVYHDTLYVYTGHDEDHADFFWMQEWRCYSTTDMVNWTDQGSPLAIEDFSWADDRAWAPQLIERDGKFYFYVPLHSKLTNAMAIGVAVGDSPTGPFHDALGHPLADGNWDYIDPTVLVDTTTDKKGNKTTRAYLYWGNPELYYVELNDDMISFKGEIQHFEMDEQSFGGPSLKARKAMQEASKPQDPTTSKPQNLTTSKPHNLTTSQPYKDIYTEGPWISKRGNLYYMLYAAGGVPEHIAYSTAPGPLGPWTYRGTIMPQCNSDKATGKVGTDSFTNHCGVADFKGHSYFFYHNGWLGGGFGRAVAVEEFQYNADGTIPTILPTREGVQQPLGTLNPRQRVEAETMAFSHGLKSEQQASDSPKGYEVYLSEIHNGDWMKVRNVDFGAEAPAEVKLRMASGLRGGTVELHLDSLGGEKIAEVQVTGTGGWEQWQSFTAPVSANATGVHDLYFAFRGRKGPKLFNFDCWQMTTAIPNAWIWADYPDPDIIRVGEYYYLVTTTMHLTPGAPILRSRDLVNWEVASYLFDEIKDTPRYDLEEGTVYGRGQWATSLRYNNGTFWALFVANDDPHKSMVFRTQDPAKDWTLHSRLPAYHDSSLFFDEDGRVYVFSGSGDIRLVELNADLTAEKEGGIRKKLELQGRPEGLHEGSRVIKKDGYYYLLCISWPRTGRQEICYRSKNIEGPYESKVILKSEFGGFPYAGQGTIVDGKDGEWYGVMFQDRGGCGRVLTLEPCEWIDGWPMLGYGGDTKIPETMNLYPQTLTQTDSAKRWLTFANGVTVEKDYQWNHNQLHEAIDTLCHTADSYQLTLTSARRVDNLFAAPNTLTWRTWGPTCADTVQFDASQMLDGDRAGLAALNGDCGLVSIVREGNSYALVFGEQNVALSNDTKAITNVEQKELARVAIRKSQLRDIRLVMTGDFRPGRDIATFHYSLDHGKTWQQIGGDYKMIFDYRRLFMGSRYAAFYYATKTTGGKVSIKL